MRDQRSDRIITCASGSAVSGVTGFTGYAMAKALVMTLRRKAAREWGPRWRESHRMSPVGYLGDADEDCFPAVAFMASAGARYLNGQMIGVCGGLQLLA